MNQVYPKRIIYFLSACLGIFFLLIASRLISNFRFDCSNFTLTDRYINGTLVIFSILALVSTIGLFYQKKWPWILVISSLFDRNHYGRILKKYKWI